MGTGRVEGEHRNAVVSNTVQPSENALAALDTLVGIQPSEPAVVTELHPAGHLDFEALIDVLGQRGSAVASRSPNQWIADLIEPRISDPALLKGGRSLSILEKLASDIIPNLDENEELRSLASALLADEIECHRELATRIQSGIGL
jgi:hypothetical protein